MSEQEKNPLLPEWIEPLEGDAPARFKIRGLSGLDALELMPEVSLSEDGKQYLVTGKGLKLALMRGLVDWEDHVGNGGKAIPFSSINFETISPIKMRQLAMAIIYKTQFTEGAQKNY